MLRISFKKILEEFFNFFKNNEHKIIEGASIVPKNDPTLLFINSGMAPIKRYFTGEEKPPAPRLCNSQPCIRTIDIDSVGDKHHLTSFQMLGNWGINDYFKKEAIEMSFEFLTKCLKISKEKLFVTYFAGDEKIGLPADEESRQYWKTVGMPENRIIACGKEDNFWGPTSETGPCGPCTEIFYDTGDGEEYTVGGYFDTQKRYIEIWNAGVFMQLNKNADGSYSRLNFMSVDAGAGLERLSMVLNGSSSVYETDLLAPIKEKILVNINKKNKISEKDLLVLTDHLRTICLILSEKIRPSNDGRGYIPRKLIRKCIMIMQKYKIKFDFTNVLRFIINEYSSFFTNFKLNSEFIIEEFKVEQKQFEKILKSGLEKLKLIKNTSDKISDQNAFELVTTYGLPFETLKNFACENQLRIDETGFQELLEKHKKISKNEKNKDTNLSLDVVDLSNFNKTEFIGYENSECYTKIVGILKENQLAEIANENENVALILEKTCMYAESGGQCADKGSIFNKNFEMKVDDVKKYNNGIFVHFGQLLFGKVEINDKVCVKIDENRSKKITNNHSAAHLLQSALKKVLGKEVSQAGSKIEADKFRFDFSYDKQISQENIFKIEQTVNSFIERNVSSIIETKRLSDAIEEGAIALFDSKYGENVRVVTFDDISKELCGGTHVKKTGDIGCFAVLSSEGIGKGIKRITATTGLNAIAYFQQNAFKINEISKILKVSPDKICDKIAKIVSNDKPKIGDYDDKICETEIKYNEVNSNLKLGVIVKINKNKAYNHQILEISEKIKGIVLCICGKEKKQVLISSSSKINESLSANVLLSKLLHKIGGNGGGNARLATGGTEIDSKTIENAMLKILKAM